MNKEYFGQYKVVDELGRGGMGVVYKAHDESLNRDVAIKVLAEQLANDDSVVERFKREAKSMAALNDASIIQIYFIGEDDGQPYFVMEYVDGESLSERLKRDGRLAVDESVRILTEAARGLALAHRSGVVHRDIKPGNLMLTSAGSVKIADFGIAMVQDLSKRLTNTGEFVGTPGYLSPEVCVGQPVDQRSDIFALGIVLYEMLTGDIPFTEASPLGMMLEVVKADIPDVRTVNADVDERTCQILARMIAKDPEHRYQSCDELLEDLRGSAPVASPVAGGAAASNEFQQARTTALSQLEALPELSGAQPAAATVVSVPGGQPRPATETPAKAVQGNKAALPIAIAALLVVGVAGGAAYQFRDRLFGSDDTPTDVVVNKAQTVTPAEVAVEDTPNADDTPALDAGGENPDDALLAALDEEAAEKEAALDAGKTSFAANTAAVQDTQNVVATNLPAGGEEVDSPSVQTPAQTSQGASKSMAAPSEQPPLQVAAVTQPKAVEQALEPPRDPRMVVVAVGDAAIAGPVEQLLENALLDRELDVLDEAFFADIGRYADDRGVDLAGLSGLIQDNGGDVLVLAEVDYIGETPLQYYGNYTTLYSVNVKIRNIDLADRRPLGRGWSRKVDFTSLNADEKAREAVGPILDDVADALARYQR